MANTKKAELFCITLSTYKDYISRYTSNIKAWEELHKTTQRIIKALRWWCDKNGYLFITELYIVLSKSDTGRYYPHVHGVIAVDSMEVIRRIEHYWRREGLGKGEYTQDDAGNVSKGNIHIQNADMEKSYGTRNNIQYGILGFLKYSKEQQDEILINNGSSKIIPSGEFCRKSIKQDNIPNAIKSSYSFLGRGRYEWGQIYDLWARQELDRFSELDSFFSDISCQKYSDNKNRPPTSPISTREEEKQENISKTVLEKTKPPIMIGDNTNTYSKDDAKELYVTKEDIIKINPLLDTFVNLIWERAEKASGQHIDKMRFDEVLKMYIGISLTAIGNSGSKYEKELKERDEQIKSLITALDFKDKILDITKKRLDLYSTALEKEWKKNDKRKLMEELENLHID